MVSVFSCRAFLGRSALHLAPFCRTVVRSFQNALGTAFVGLENYRMVLGKYSVSDSGRQYPAVHVRVHSVAGRRVTCAICCFAETNIHKKRTEKYVSCTGGGSGSLSRARMEATVSFQRPAEPCVACDGRGEGGVDDDVRLLLGARAQLSVEESRI